MERYDIAIIGTGPAGLSAAVTATVRNKKVLLLGKPTISRIIWDCRTSAAKTWPKHFKAI